MKTSHAARALDLLSNHVDIFEGRDENLREEEALKAFADSELLAELTLNRTACGQLLITNDRRLSEDAYKLNDQTSCRGRKVMVCFINKFGELRKCECTKEPVSFNQDKTIDTEQSNSPANDKIQAVPDSMPEQPINQQAHKLQIGRILIPFAPLMESGAKPSLRSGTPLRGWASTVCIRLMRIQTYTYWNFCNRIPNF